MHRLPFVLACVLCLLPAAFGQGQQPVCAELTADNLSYFQDFDTLWNVNNTQGTIMPVGFGYAESGSLSNATYSASSGDSTATDTRSFGRPSGATQSDRAFGGVRGANLNPTIGACFTNSSGKAIVSVNITFDGEMWRLGEAGRVDRLDFQYSLDATSLTTGTWTDADELDFITPNITGTFGFRVGNDPAYRRAGISHTIQSLNIPHGSTIYIRYLDFDVPSSADDGLGIDNFSLTAVTAPTSANVSISGRVLTADGRGVPFALVSISGPDIVARTARANPFGHFRFTELTNGKSYIVSVSPKSLNIAVPSRMITLNEDVTDFDFIAEPR